MKQNNKYLKDERNKPLDIVNKCLLVALGIYVLTSGIISNG